MWNRSLIFITMESRAVSWEETPAFYTTEQYYQKDSLLCGIRNTYHQCMLGIYTHLTAGEYINTMVKPYIKGADRCIFIHMHLKMQVGIYIQE